MNTEQNIAQNVQQDNTHRLKLSQLGAILKTLRMQMHDAPKDAFRSGVMAALALVGEHASLQARENSLQDRMQAQWEKEQLPMQIDPAKPATAKDCTVQQSTVRAPIDSTVCTCLESGICTHCTLAKQREQIAAQSIAYVKLTADYAGVLNKYEQAQALLLVKDQLGAEQSNNITALKEQIAELRVGRDIASATITTQARRIQELYTDNVSLMNAKEDLRAQLQQCKDGN